MDWTNWTFELFGLMMFIMVAAIPLVIMFYTVAAIIRAFKTALRSVGRR